jgi:glyceraldehyde-3-phosphate dehydrogenase/erythrose-4-phosphate dehydrogenase
MISTFSLPLLQQMPSPNTERRYSWVCKGHLETIHSYTNDPGWQHAQKNRGRAAALNMVITETGAGTAVAKALPSLEGN